jgi:hypothetical protein
MASGDIAISPSHFLSNIMAMIKNLARPTMMVCSPLSVCSVSDPCQASRCPPHTAPSPFPLDPTTQFQEQLLFVLGTCLDGLSIFSLTQLTHAYPSLSPFHESLPSFISRASYRCHAQLPPVPIHSGGWGVHPSSLQPSSSTLITTPCGRGTITGLSFRVPRTHIVTNHWGLLGRAVGLWDVVCRLTVPVYSVGVNVQARAMVQTRTMAEVC